MKYCNGIKLGHSLLRFSTGQKVLRFHLPGAANRVCPVSDGVQLMTCETAAIDMIISAVEQSFCLSFCGMLNAGNWH